MSDAEDNGAAKAHARLGRHLALTRWGMALERLWPALWPAISIVGFYVALSLFDPWPSVPFWFHSLALAGCLGSALLFSRRAATAFTWPSENEARRRLEKQARLKHRPLNLVDEKAATNSGPLGRAIWALHRRRALAGLEAIKARAPRAGLQYRDPRAIRALLIMALLVAMVDAGSDWKRRLEAGFMPQFGASAPLSAQAWVTPPDYTGLPPQTLLSQDAGNLSNPKDVLDLVVPAGSILTARVEGGWRTPVMTLAGTRQKFEEKGAFYEIERSIDVSGELEISAGSALRARWQVTALPDQPPQVFFNKDPAPTARKALRLDYSLQDDYGVSAVTFEVRLVGPKAPDPDEREILEVALAGAETQNETVRRTFFSDLTPHPWAGRAVEGRLTARDAIGQQGTGSWVSFTLPQRIFTHPVARNLNYIRKGLFANPERREGAARRLDIQARLPDEFQNNLSVYSALRFASMRLTRSSDDKSLREVTGILWDAALHLEDGRTSAAERALRDAFDEAARMLENSSATNNFDELTEQIARLMQEYLAKALSDTSPPGEMEMGEMQAIDARSLEALLQQIRDLAAAGKTEEALELLNALRGMMENISPAPMSAGDYRRLMEGAQAMNELENIRRQQADLKDRTAKQSMLQALMERLGDTRADLSVQAQEQGELEGALGQTLKNLGSAGIQLPRSLNEAAASMSRAENRLTENKAPPAIAAQEKALQALTEGMGELSQQLSSSLAAMRAGAMATDPLGRPSALDTADRLLPQESETEAAHRILQELRDRLSRPDIPEVELDYIRRLLRRF